MQDRYCTKLYCYWLKHVNKKLFEISLSGLESKMLHYTRLFNGHTSWKEGEKYQKETRDSYCALLLLCGLTFSTLFFIWPLWQRRQRWELWTSWTISAILCTLLPTTRGYVAPGAGPPGWNSFIPCGGHGDFPGRTSKGIDKVVCLCSIAAPIHGVYLFVILKASDVPRFRKCMRYFPLRGLRWTSSESTMVLK